MRVYAPADSPPPGRRISTCRVPSSWEEDFHLQSPLLLGGGFPPADSPPPGRRISTCRLPSSWEEG